MSLTQGAIPDSGKLANVIPVFKRKGFRIDDKSYRLLAKLVSFVSRWRNC